MMKNIQAFLEFTMNTLASYKKVCVGRRWIRRRLIRVCSRRCTNEVTRRGCSTGTPPRSPNFQQHLSHLSEFLAPPISLNPSLFGVSELSKQIFVKHASLGEVVRQL